MQPVFTAGWEPNQEANNVLGRIHVVEVECEAGYEHAQYNSNKASPVAVYCM